jgi:hypothetical protein
MNATNIFNAVREEYDEETAITVVCVLTIATTVSLKKKDFQKEGRYVKRRNKRIKQFVAATEEEIEIMDALYEYTTRIAMEGVGGCTVATIKEIVAKNKEINRENSV